MRDLIVDADRRTCRVGDRPVSLTKTEFSVLLELCRARGAVVSSDDLYFKVFGEAYFSTGSNSIAVHIRHLREKLGSHGRDGGYIKTVWGCGYRIDS